MVAYSSSRRTPPEASERGVKPPAPGRARRLDRPNTVNGVPGELRVLLVEDSPGDADLCRIYLEEGFGSRLDVIHVTHLGQAANAIEEHRLDVILLDLGLPDSMGVQSVIALRRAAPDVPIVVLTGNRDTQLGVQVIREHAQDFCAKQDLNPGLLLQSVRHAIERHRLQSQYSRLLETSPDGMVVIDERYRLLFVNHTACELLGLEPVSADGAVLPADLRPNGTDEIELRNRQVVEVRSVSVDWNNVPATLVSYRDVTARKHAESRLRQLVQYDQLTGLASRNYFFDYMERLVSNVTRDSGMAAMLFLDLDRFKYVNDTLGHEAGDELLRRVGERLSGTVRAGDFVARLGGDEFAVVLPDIDGPAEAGHVANHLLNNFEQPLEVLGSRIGVGVSIGIATFPQCGKDVKALYRAADTAMYRAKEQGANRYQFFADHMQHQVERRIRVEQAVRRVAAEQGFWLAYQPQVRATDGAPVGFEALLRWPAHVEPKLSPTEFIPIAEDIGLIGRIGRDVLYAAANMAVQTMPLINAPMRVAVNVSMRQLYDSNLLTEIEEVLQATGLSPECLEIELTESSVMGDPIRAQRTLEAIRMLGVAVAIDDFGTGYSSLSYLRRLPVDVLKIDQSFVAEIGVNVESEAILHGLVGMSHALGLRVVAEGVETEEQQAFLLDAGCDTLQGYRICRPITDTQFADWLRRAARKSR